MTRLTAELLDRTNVADAAAQAEREVSALVVALRDEQNALIEGDSDRLIDACRRKEEHAVALSDLIRARGEANAFMARIMTQLSEAAQLNRTNENLLTIRMDAVRGALTVLASASGQGYGSDGKMAMRGPRGLSVQA